MIPLLEKVAAETVQVTLLVFVMMLLVDVLNVRTRGRITGLLRGSRPWLQYVVAPVVAAFPGCIGAFSVVSLYQHGMVSFGALAGAMIAASGDEAFLMLALFPGRAIPLFLLLVALGVLFGPLVDMLVRHFRIKTCDECPEVTLHEAERGFRHYLREHVWGHIVKRHLWRTALWTVGALLLAEIAMQHADLSGLASRYPLLFLAVAALIGLIPQSGPHFIVVTLFAGNVIPFSVLLTSAIVQDGHGMLPMFAHSVRASVVLKALNLAFGLIIGLLVFLAGF